MYSDNETDVDLLGFEDQVHSLVDLITDPAVLPVTAGVLADWGSGKSSLLKMTAKGLRDQNVVVIEFSPWRIETYDDAKTAFLSAVIEQVADHLPDEPDTPRGQRALKQLNMLRKRVKWMRVAGLAAKKVITMSAPSLDDLDGLLRNDDELENQPSTESVSRDFRDKFEELVAGLEGRTVAVLVDDLDRSLPEQVPEILQAIRLFLSVPGTAFVLATDERVVRDAIRLRYPQATETSETDLASEYLEKIVQVPVRIPRIGSAETESYLNLLVAQRHFDAAQMDSCLAKAKETRASGTVGVSMNLGIARDAIGHTNVTDDAEREFALMGRVAHLLAIGLKGNPRQLKRYLNGFEMRWLTAKRRNLDLDRGVLAKLMVLEYAFPGRYRDLHEFIGSRPDSNVVLGALEERARSTLGVQESEPPASSSADSEPRVQSSRTSFSPPGSSSSQLHAVPESDLSSDQPRAIATSASEPVVPTEAQRWLESAWELDWLALEPRLSEVDLGPYFELGRAALPSSAVRARALPVALQRLLQQMASPTVEIRDVAAEQAAALEPADAAQLTDAAVDRLRAEADPGNLIQSLATLTSQHPSLIPGLFRALAGVPFDSLKAGLPRAFARRMKAAAEPNQLSGLLNLWGNQTVNPRLAKSSKQAINDIN